jgi:hypothetical protein
MIRDGELNSNDDLENHWTEFNAETGNKMSFDDTIAPVGHDDQLE